MNLLKSSYKFGKSLITSTETEMKLSWLSVLVLYKDPKNGFILYKAYIFIGNIPDHYYGYFLDFPSNYTPCPEIYLHIHIGDTIFDINYFTDNPAYYRHYVSNPRNKIWKIVNDNLDNKVKIINYSDKDPLFKIPISDRAKKIIHPRFNNKQVYGTNMDHVLFSNFQ